MTKCQNLTINSKLKYYQIQNKSKIPNPNILDFEIGIYLVVFVVFGFGIFEK
jgi:hypothetical protein